MEPQILSCVKIPVPSARRKGGNVKWEQLGWLSNCSDFPRLWCQRVNWPLKLCYAKHLYYQIVWTSARPRHWDHELWIGFSSAHQLGVGENESHQFLRAFSSSVSVWQEPLRGEPEEDELCYPGGCANCPPFVGYSMLVPVLQVAFQHTAYALKLCSQVKVG